MLAGGAFLRRGAAAAVIALAVAGCGPEPGGVRAGQGASSAPGGEAASCPTGPRQGPNGPIPVIVVDQFGYRPGSAKVAVLRRPMVGYDKGSEYSPGPRISLVDAQTGDKVLDGPAQPWRDGEVDTVSGDIAWWFDFSTVRTPGRYYVEDAACGARSAEFRVADDVYVDVLRAALRTFFYQRAGQAKPADLAGSDWADGASHLGPGQDGEARSWLAKADAASARDLRGGWYDAGDYNKYTPWHARYLLALLHTYAENPQLVGDDLGIPESGNGVSDLLDEIDWGLQWLARMQNPDGSVLSIQGLGDGSPPSSASEPSFYGPATTHATLTASAAFAWAATVFSGSDVPALDRKAKPLAERALRAWEWAQANPEVTFFNNDDSKQPGSAGLGGGQQETDRAGRAKSHVQAAIYLYGLTQEERFRDYVQERIDSYLPPDRQPQWTVPEQETLLYYVSLPGVPAEVRDSVRGDYVARLKGTPELLGSPDPDPYRAPLAHYTWGSNRFKSAQGRMLALTGVHDYPPAVAEPALAAAEGYLHYLHGVNPLGLVYLTNMGSVGAESSANTLYHRWFADGTRWDAVSDRTPGPPPGLVVGGPNPGFSVDKCCATTCGGPSADRKCRTELSPPSGQPPMKSYLQFNDDWPLNSWEVTENSNGYQVEYIRLLALFSEPRQD